MITENDWVKTNLTKSQKDAIKTLLLGLESTYSAASFIAATAKSDKRESEVKITAGVHGGPPHYWITVEVQINRDTSVKTCHIYVLNQSIDAWIFLMNPGPGPNGKAVSVEDPLRVGIDWI